MRLIKSIFTLTITFFLTACLEDLNPESKDLRTSTSDQVENFIATTSLNEEVRLEDELLTHDALVLYFTMWCPLCDSHMTHMRNHVINNYQNVRFLMVDYVSASINQSRASQLANGYSDMTLLVDNNQNLLNALSATMASVIVINDQNTILLNEDYKNGARLIEVLDRL